MVRVSRRKDKREFWRKTSAQGKQDPIGEGIAIEQHTEGASNLTVHKDQSEAIALEAGRGKAY